MSLKIFTVDAFTDRNFAGNPAAVCFLNDNLDDELMKNIAAEMNLSETAFVKKEDGEYNLRWFTPKIEVQLCGHATLAAAHLLWEEGLLPKDEDAKFNTLSGQLFVKNIDGEYEMNFPATEVKESVYNSELVNALGVEPVKFAETEHIYIVELANDDGVFSASPDFNALSNMDKFGAIITAKSSDERFDFISRYFVPAKGINEDPVTGSAHCALGPYWSQKTGKEKFSAYQASLRGGGMKIKLDGDRIFLTGRAVTFLKGEIVF
ncbi:MAG: PhzF family phenazine biosynthesis protein [Planctomycetales bacterium]|nr:PhzF family phenazine biosynthesis protein [Planctomycetales bacterium]